MDHNWDMSIGEGTIQLIPAGRQTATDRSGPAGSRWRNGGAALAIRRFCEPAATQHGGGRQTFDLEKEENREREREREREQLRTGLLIFGSTNRVTASGQKAGKREQSARFHKKKQKQKQTFARVLGWPV